MFNNNRIETYAKLIGLTVEELDIFMKRYKGYLLKQKELTKNILINGLFILEDIHADKWIEEANKVKYKTKNLLVIKYEEEIVNLYKNGMGSIRIAKYLKLNHKVTLSKSAIDRFIAANKISRN